HSQRERLFTGLLAAPGHQHSCRRTRRRSLAGEIELRCPANTAERGNQGLQRRSIRGQDHFRQWKPEISGKNRDLRYDPDPWPPGNPDLMTSRTPSSSIVAHALVRAASTLVSTPGIRCWIS